MYKYKKKKYRKGKKLEKLMNNVLYDTVSLRLNIPRVTQGQWQTRWLTASVNCQRNSRSYEKVHDCSGQLTHSHLFGDNLLTFMLPGTQVMYTCQTHNFVLLGLEIEIKSVHDRTNPPKDYMPEHQ